jgi:hypothetical protein
MILVIGDSHSRMFDGYFKTCSVDGATVRGLLNPKSKTNALIIFKETINLYKPRVLIVMLGEVDINFLIPYRVEIEKKDYGKELSEFILRYVTFIEYLETLEFIDKIIICAVQLPTHESFVPERKQIKMGIGERTQLTIKFNNVLKNKCTKKKVHIIDINREIMGVDGLVKDSYIIPGDHHLKDTVDIWIKHLKNIINF